MGQINNFTKGQRSPRVTQRLGVLGSQLTFEQFAAGVLWQ